LEHFDFEGEDMENLLPEALRDSMPAPYMLQLLPGIHECDGFFIAKFRKRS
jgi:16S rRNA (cytosine967-C5)-methyltransferase